MEKFLWAFIVGGLICVIGQLLMDGLKLTPAHTTCTLVVVGAILGGLGLYDRLVDFAGQELPYRSAVLGINWYRVHCRKQNGLGSLECLRVSLRSRVQGFHLQSYSAFGIFDI